MHLVVYEIIIANIFVARELSDTIGITRKHEVIIGKSSMKQRLFNDFCLRSNRGRVFVVQ